jgi:hypothetical protein
VYIKYTSSRIRFKRLTPKSPKGDRYNALNKPRRLNFDKMETIAFATLLFVVYFCSACCFLYNPQTAVSAEASTSVPVVAAFKSTVTPQEITVAPEPSTVEVAATRKEPSQDEELEADKREAATALVEATIASKEPEQILLEEPTTLEQLLKGIDLDKLQLRPARKIAGRLNIQQKVNGKDQPLGFLRAQIKKRLSEQPQEVAPVIEEILRAS